MDAITRHRLAQEAERFIASIDQAAVCALAPSVHPANKQCYPFDDVKKGGFNASNSQRMQPTTAHPSGGWSGFLSSHA